MVEPIEVYYEILMRANYSSILKLLRETQIDRAKVGIPKRLIPGLTPFMESLQR